MTEAKKNKPFSIQLVKRILSYSKPYKKLFMAAIFLTLTLSSLTIVRPLLIRETLNAIAIEDANDPGFLSPADKLSFINTMGLLLLGILIFEALLQFTNIYVTNLLGQN